MKLLGNRILVEPLVKKETSHGGVVMPQQYNDDQMQYRVVAVGPGKNGVPLEVQPGDCVLCNVWVKGDYVLPDGKRIMDVDNVLMKWKQ